MRALEQTLASFPLIGPPISFCLLNILNGLYLLSPRHCSIWFSIVSFQMYGAGEQFGTNVCWYKFEYTNNYLFAVHLWTFYRFLRLNNSIFLRKHSFVRCRHSHEDEWNLFILYKMRADFAFTQLRS